MAIDVSRKRKELCELSGRPLRAGAAIVSFLIYLELM
jgi:hypothetical protein